MKTMKTWYIMDYQNGNKAIFEKSEYEKAQLEEYGIDATAEGYYDEAIAGVVEAEKKPEWDELQYDEEEQTYYLK